MNYLRKATISIVTLLFISGVFVNNAFAAAPLARIVVAKSGGNYTTITAALAAITPTATNRYVIEVWPGVYTESGAVTLKSYVHIKGSGRDVTIVNAPNAGISIFTGTNLTNVAISGLTIKGGYAGVFSDNISSFTVTDNTISNNQYGVLAYNGSTATLITGNNILANTTGGVDVLGGNATITGNRISGNGSAQVQTPGIYLNLPAPGSIKTVINGNLVVDNSGVGIWVSSDWDGNVPTISNNVIEGNAFNGVYYVQNYQGKVVGGTLINNKIVNNGDPTQVGPYYTDILVAGPPNISFNVFDDITGTSGVGSFNVNSNGDSILVP